MPQYIDIIVPSKDRAIQLHLLLESMGKHLSSIGRVTVTWQGSNDEFIYGYELLKERVFEDDFFSSLRKKSKEIRFTQRHSLREVYDAVVDSGDSKYLLPLVDDDVFFHDYDLVNQPASKVFFKNDSVIACSLRLGDNLSDQVSSTLGDGLINDQPAGHASSLLSTGKPRYIYPFYGHEMSSSKHLDGFTNQYVVWAWVDNMNVPHWNLPFSTTSNIYRKPQYQHYMESIGRENFLLIESIATRKKLDEFFQLPDAILAILKCLDKIQYKILKNYGVYEQEILQIQLAKILFRNRLKCKKKIDVPVYMVAPKHSCIFNLDSCASHNRKIGYEKIACYNQKYIEGYVILYSDIPFDNVKFPLHTFRNASLKKYEKKSNNCKR